MRWGFDNAAIGLGDLFVYSLFLLAAYKAYGRAAGRLALTVIVLFGAVLPALIPLVINYVDTRTDTMVPGAVWFGAGGVPDLPVATAPLRRGTHHEGVPGQRRRRQTRTGDGSAAARDARRGRTGKHAAARAGAVGDVTSARTRG